MLDVNKKNHTGHPSSIAQWAYQAIGLKAVRLRTRLQGNDLHLLCESTKCPEAAIVVSRLLQALNAEKAASPLPTDSEHPIYQIILYGRVLDRQRPEWIEALYLNRLDEHRSRWQHRSKKARGDRLSGEHENGEPLPTSPANANAAVGSGQARTEGQGLNSGGESADRARQQESAVPETPSALLVSDESLAQTGQPEAIARYLSETLSPLGVGVKVVIQEANKGAKKQGSSYELKSSQVSAQGHASNQKLNLDRRLWVVCSADYSPDPSLVAQAVTQRLRQLNLEGFRDARVLGQVSGETSPDWVLRVDMTPPEEMLEDWARWGDVQAIARLLNQALGKDKIQVRAVLKEATLHLFCTKSQGRDARSYSKADNAASAAPDKQTVMRAIAPVLESIGPQGIQAATVYGLKSRLQKDRAEKRQESLHPVPSPEGTQEGTPVWIEWLNLPACCCPALAEPALALAQQGDEPALVFLLQRLLNSDLDWRLATGGIRLTIRRKQDLFHIMTEAPVCPLQSQVASSVAKFIRQLAIPRISGVRVYGRRAGQSSPLWSYGVDFTLRMRKSPPVEFADGADFGSDQLVLASPDRAPELSQENSSGLSQTFQEWGRKLASSLCATQLFIPAPQDKEDRWSFFIGHSSSAVDKGQRRRVALVWGCLGLLLTFQSDWLIGSLLRRSQPESTQSSALVASGQGTTPSRVKPIPQMSLQKNGSSKLNVARNKAATFNSSGFTKQGETSIIVNERGSAAREAILAAARSPLPSFNNRLLDEKLALYQQRLQQRGGVPPEVLIVGSSRAMRGVDPTALKTALAGAGFGNVEVFNFGINGATAQVVDLLVRRILSSSQLPKLIVWADGARAFNSGRVDATYSAIARSAGYQQLSAGIFPTQRAPAALNRSATATAAKARLTSGENGHVSGRPSLTSSYQAVETQLNQAISHISSTYPQRQQLVSLIQSYFAQLIPSDAEDEAKDGGLERKREDEDANLIHLNSDIDFDGFLPLSIRFVPSTYYKRHAKVSGDYDSDYESFQMRGQQDAALDALVQYVQNNQIQLVFVNLPLTKEYLDPIRMRYEQEFQQHMRQMAIQKGFIFRDLSNLWPTKNEYFSDPSHLNQYGAFEVSNQLIHDPMIPWPTLERKN